MEINGIDLVPFAVSLQTKCLHDSYICTVNELEQIKYCTAWYEDIEHGMLNHTWYLI